VEFTAPAEQDTGHDCLLVKLRGRP
jgi:hypothetical protein